MLSLAKKRCHLGGCPGFILRKKNVSIEHVSQGLVYGCLFWTLQIECHAGYTATVDAFMMFLDSFIGLSPLIDLPAQVQAEEIQAL